MKVANADSNVLSSSGLKQTQGFTISASAHAFKMLSSGLYSDKIGAVLREIACNAFDAHVEAGCRERPIRVKLPNVLDDQFYVQDWGPGLSHDAVMNLYTSYFTSTKQTSNDFTGAFGLGSKSPFSYTGSFVVVSCFAGKKRTYSLYLDDGSPKISLMSTEPVDKDWPTGVRVGFPVKPEDYSEFEQKAHEVYQWFRVLPEIRGVKGIKPVAYRFEGEEYALLAKPEDDQIHAVMGNVRYPVDEAQLSLEDLNGAGASDLANYAAEMKGLVLRVPIGAVEVAASREQLQYNAKTIKALKDRLRAGVTHLGREVIDKIEASTTAGWASMCEASQLADSLVGASGLRYKFSALAEALGTDPKKVKIFQEFVNNDHIPVPACLGKYSDARIVRREKHSRSTRPQSYFVRGEKSIYRGQRIQILSNTVIAVGLESLAVSRARAAIEAGTYDQVVLIGGDKKEHVLGKLRDEAADVSAGLMGVPVVELKDMPPPPFTGKKSKRRGKNWVPTLPVGVEYKCWLDGVNANLELGALPDQLYACHIAKSRWGRTKEYLRVYETTADDDTKHEWDDWAAAWTKYMGLQQALRLPKAPAGYAVLKPAEVKRICLPQLGWHNAIDGLREYVSRPELQTALRKKMKRKHLLAPENMFDSGGWMTALAWWLKGKTATPAMLKVLRDRGLLDQLQDMVAARLALVAKKKPDPDVPPEIQAYQDIVRFLGLEDALAKDVQQALTLEDADAAFAKRFPLAPHIEHKSLRFLDSAEDLITAVLSKEV